MKQKANYHTKYLLMFMGNADITRLSSVTKIPTESQICSFGIFSTKSYIIKYMMNISS